MRQFASPATRTALFLSILFLFVAVAQPTFAQLPDPVFRNFEPSGDYVLAIGGTEEANAKVLISNSAGAMLVMSSKLESPTLFNLRSRQIETVSFMKLLQHKQGTVDVLADASFKRIGTLSVNGNVLESVGLNPVLQLRPRPNLTGVQDADGLREHSPAYGFKAEQYEADERMINVLKAEKRDVKVKVVFYSKCPHCKEAVPRVMKIGDVLAGAGPQIEYYGLDDGWPEAADAKALKINRVPTVIVYVGGKEVSRLTDQALQRPEVSLVEALKTKG